MKRSDYRAAFDAIPFDEDFQRETIRVLREEAGRRSEKELVSMKKKRTALVTAALSALVVVSAAAAVVMLSPKDVAQRVGDSALAEAFESDQAVNINETRNVGDYAVTLMGIVSGKDLSELETVEHDDRTYAVLSMARLDGEPITEDVPDLTVTPLVEGYAPWQLNAWTLGGGTTTFAEEGRLYYLLECDNVEPYTDRTVYLAVYPGTHIPPSAERFAFDVDTGAITVKEGQECALFTLMTAE